MFTELDQLIQESYKPFIKAECIFLTHSAKQHERNLDSNRFESESLIWKSEIQEDKISEYGGKAVRYKARIKNNFIQRWTALHNDILPWNTIRYIF